MQLIILSVGKLREAYFRAAMNEYVERIAHFLKVTEVEVAGGTGDEGNGHGRGALQREGDALLRQMTKPGVIVTLEVQGKLLSTEQLAEWMQAQMVEAAERIYFVIGGAWGLSAELRTQAHLHWSLSPLTFPHELARVIVAEQLYRSLTIWKNHPYHK